MKWVLVLVLCLVWGIGGFVGGVVCAGRFGWVPPPAGSLLLSASKGGKANAAEPSIPSGDDEESIRWRKLRVQVSDYWVFLYHKTAAAHPIEGPWYILEYPLEWGPRRTFSTLPWSNFTDALQRGREHAGYVGMPLELAQKHAQALAKDAQWDATVIIDFTGNGFPRPITWYFNDGSETRQLDHPPKPEYGDSLTDFLRHLH